MEKLRVDKWLWAARFFRTRSLAKQAIESGRVRFQGKRIKVSKEVSVGMLLSIRQGSATNGNEKQVLIKALSDERGNAATAQILYEETAQSIEQREHLQAQRKLANLARPSHKPSKKERRQRERFNQKQRKLNSFDDSY